MDDRKYLFEEAPISKAIVKMAVPTMISMLVVIVYNIADTFFIGQTNDPLKVSAVSLAAPIFMLYTAIGNLFSVGGSSEISRSLGAQKEERVKHISSFCFYSMMVIGTVISIGTPCIILSCALGGIVRSVGASGQAMTGNMIGTITNIILDPIFILVLGWGVTGAAVATVIGNLFAVIYYLYYILRKQTIISVKPQDFRFKNDVAKNVFFIGTPTMLNTLLVTAVLRTPLIHMFIDNDEVVRYGIKMVTAFLFAAPVIGLYILSTNVIQAMGKVKEGFVLSICRQGILYIPAVCLLNSLLGLDGIIYAQPIVDCISTAISLILVFGLLKKFDVSNTGKMESGA